jgi:hypothetical protein
VDLLLHEAIFHCGRRYICSKNLVIITLRFINKCHTSTVVLIPKSCGFHVTKLSPGVRVTPHRLLLPHT